MCNDGGGKLQWSHYFRSSSSSKSPSACFSSVFSLPQTLLDHLQAAVGDDRSLRSALLLNPLICKQRVSFCFNELSHTLLFFFIFFFFLKEGKSPSHTHPYQIVFGFVFLYYDQNKGRDIVNVHLYHKSDVCVYISEDISSVSFV